MQKQIKLVEEFHKKFKWPIWKSPRNVSKQIYNFRFKLIDEEVKEYLEWAKKWDINNIVKELCDILYAVYWTVVAHWLQDKVEECFEEVHKSNMTKDYSETKAIKWDNYKDADINSIMKK